MSLKKSQQDDKVFCKSIAKSISDIIRFSLDEDFRKKSFELFGVSSTAETEREINKRLMFLIENGKTEFQRADATAENSLKIKLKAPEKDNTDAKDDTQTTEEAVLTSSSPSETDSQSTQNSFKRNWLQISSQQYREIIKRKKLKYYSQPQFGQNDFELFDNRAHSSNSQPSFSCFSLFSEETISSSEHLRDTTSYFKEKFRDLFKQNDEKNF